MSDEAVVDVVPKYRGNPLVDFENGVGLDLRVKMAAEMLKSPGEWEEARYQVARDGRGPTAAALALDTASALMDLAAARGLLYAVPDHDDLSGPLRRHIRRNVRAQVVQQVEGQRIMREESGNVQPVGGSAFPGMHG